MALYLGGTKIKAAYMGGVKIKQAYIAGVPAFSQNQGTFTDPRDGKVYPWRLMPDGKKWMTENLDYDPYPLGGSMVNNTALAKFANIGMYYNFAALEYAAPPGWHIPKKAEWEALLASASGLYKKLASTYGWTERTRDENGTDDYGFTALPGGQINGSKATSYLGTLACFLLNESPIIKWAQMGWGSSQLIGGAANSSSNNNSYVSIRCVRD